MPTKLTKTIQKKAIQCTDEQITSLADLAGSWFVLYFYPKDNTPGCTIEAKAFSTQLKKFKKLGCEVIGISRDSIKSHLKFIDKIGINHPLISDEDEAICNYFETLKEKSMFGRKYMGIVRSTFLIDPNGSIVHSWCKVKISGHVEEVLEAAKGAIAA